MSVSAMVPNSVRWMDCSWPMKLPHIVALLAVVNRTWRTKDLSCSTYAYFTMAGPLRELVRLLYSQHDFVVFDEARVGCSLAVIPN